MWFTKRRYSARNRSPILGQFCDFYAKNHTRRRLCFSITKNVANQYILLEFYVEA